MRDRDIVKQKVTKLLADNLSADELTMVKFSVNLSTADKREEDLRKSIYTKEAQAKIKELENERIDALAIGLGYEAGSLPENAFTKSVAVWFATHGMLTAKQEAAIKDTIARKPPKP